jgi:hypothetical protein
VVGIPALRMVLVSKREPKTKRAMRPPHSLRKKGKAHMASSHYCKNHAYIYAHAKNVHHATHLCS